MDRKRTLVCTAMCIAGLAQATARVGAMNDDKDKAIQKMTEDRKNRDDAPAVGTEAPNFKLKTADGKSEVELTALRASKPVVLIFGSYT